MIFLFISRYHTGSIAFGSLLIAIIQLIRIILEYIDHKLKGKENRVVKFILCCCKCCFWCLEKFMKFINRNAYIMVISCGFLDSCIGWFKVMRSCFCRSRFTAKTFAGQRRKRLSCCCEIFWGSLCWTKWRILLYLSVRI